MKRQDFVKVSKKLGEFMIYCQKVNPDDSYLIVDRNCTSLAEAAENAAEEAGLKVRTFNLALKRPYKHFPKELIAILSRNTPKAGIGLFDYSLNPDWNLKEVGARIELLHQTIEEVPISWAHSPGITMDMAINGPLQCDYREMALESEKTLDKLHNIRKIHITAQGGTDIEIEMPAKMKFDTDCIITPPNIYGKPGRFGNLPVGEVWAERGETTKVLNKETGQIESQNYPVKLTANGKVVCDVTAGGYPGRINPEKPLIAKFKNGVLIELQHDDPALDSIHEDIAGSQSRYGLPTVLEEVGIGLNEKARITGNMLEDEKIKGTCHLAPGNIRCHVDMLVDKPTIVVCCNNGATKEIMSNGIFT